MANRFLCKAFGKGWRRDVADTCNLTYSSCLTNTPCVTKGFRITLADCGRHFRRQASFSNYKKQIGKKNAVCEWERQCVICDKLVGVSGRAHESGKRYCDLRNAYRDIDYLRFIQPLKNLLPPNDEVLYVFHEYETTRNMRYSDTAKEHYPNLTCIEQFHSQYEGIDNCERGSYRCLIRNHEIWEDPVADLITYIFEPKQ